MDGTAYGFHLGQRTRVVHLRQVIGRIRWWRRVRAEWCHHRDKGNTCSWKEFKAGYYSVGEKRLEIWIMMLIMMIP